MLTENILNQVTDGVIVVDQDGQVLMLNQAARKALDLGDVDLEDLSIQELALNEDLLQALQADGEADAPMELATKDGRYFKVRISRVPEIGTVLSLHDISYLKELDRLKGDFVNTVSHDLRSPLTAILGYVELIERSGEINDQQAEFIRRAKDSVQATTDLVGDLLNLGRLEVGLIEDMRVLQLKDLVDQAAEVLAAQVEHGGQTLRVAVEGEVGPVAGSPPQLRQVVDNLIGNAVKYTPQGGEIRVLLREEAGQVILHVADNGPGIPAEEQGRIFEKFYRASNVAEDVEGTGLGLAIVQSVVDQHRGRIWVDSKPGAGAIFTVVLPAASRSPEESRSS